MLEVCRMYYIICGDDVGVVLFGINDLLIIIFRVLNRRYLIVFKIFLGICVRFFDILFL